VLRKCHDAKVAGGPGAPQGGQPHHYLGRVIRFGVYSGPQHATFEQYLELWRRCEELGYDWLSVFDHFMPIVGDPGGPCFEGPTMMAAMAAHTSRVRVAILVTGVTYRHPAVAANIAATIDHISGGRAEYGIGAAWMEDEHEQYGIPFPRLGVRMDMLDEACRVMRGLWTQPRFSFEGEHYRLHEARMEPKPVQEHLPLIIGGDGEKRTLRIVAEHADVWNTGLHEVETFRHKLDVLARHCEAVGRDPATIRKSLTLRAVLAPDEASLARRRREVELPVEVAFLTTEQCAERMRPFAELGGNDFLLAAYAPYDWESLELFVREVAPQLR
jgi:F420-dependent oxidoreductase-like protein